MKNETEVKILLSHNAGLEKRIRKLTDRMQKNSNFFKTQQLTKKIKECTLMLTVNKQVLYDTIGYWDFDEVELQKGCLLVLEDLQTKLLVWQNRVGKHHFDYHNSRDTYDICGVYASDSIQYHNELKKIYSDFLKELNEF